LILLIMVFSMVIWAPWIGEDLGRHKRLAQGIVFPGFNFAALIYVLWESRRPRPFWISMVVVFPLHVFGVCFYSTSVRSVLVWQWPLLGILEFYIIFFLSDGLANLFGRRHHH